MILFVVLLNVGMYVVFELTYQKDIAVEQKQAENEYNMLTGSLVRSLNSLYNQGDVTDTKLRKVVEKHENYYDDTLYLTLWKEQTCIYPEGEENLRDWNDVSNVNQIIITGNAQKKIIVQGKLYEGKETLYLRYEKELTKLNEVWDKLQINYLDFDHSIAINIILETFSYMHYHKTPRHFHHLQ